MIVRDTVSLAICIHSEWFSIKTQTAHTASEAARVIGLAGSLQYLPTYYLSTINQLIIITVQFVKLLHLCFLITVKFKENNNM